MGHALSEGRAGPEGDGYLMIKSINIRNFRCFEHLTIPDCRRINVIVGDSGTGKTALLEAIFLALASSPEVAARLRQVRGNEGMFNATGRAIEEALWGGLFYRWDTRRTVSIALEGTGPEARSVSIGRGAATTVLPLSAELEPIESFESNGPISFNWRDSSGRFHPSIPLIGVPGASPIQFAAPSEDLPDFYLFSATQPYMAAENAGRFSLLSRAGLAAEFVQEFITEYDWVEGLSIEVVAGSPAIFASVKGLKEKIPLNDISGATTKIVGITVAMAISTKGIVLVDEIENGVYYKHLESMWSTIIRFARRFDCQIVTSTHSKECLDALVRAADGEVDDVMLWRIERSESGHTVSQFHGDTLKAGLEFGQEVR